MKTLKTTIVILLFILSASCSKDEAPTPVTPIIYGEENPLFTFLSRMPNIHPYVNAAGGIAQTGYIFKPTVKGKINTLTVKLPATNSALKVFIWDKATIALVRSEVINVATANTEITKIIPPLALEKDKEYLITIYTDDYYDHSTNNSSAISYPIIAGNIQILGTRSGSGELFPQAGGSSNGYSGDIGFNFQRTE
jgi:hypothetical protein